MWVEDAEAAIQQEQDDMTHAEIAGMRSREVLAPGPGNAPAVRVRNTKTVRFGSKPIQKPDPLHLGGPNPDPYLSTCGFCCVWLDPSVPISYSGIRVILFMVTFSYPIVNRKILTLVYCCPSLIYWPPS
jgi:hypothetical protein